MRLPSPRSAPRKVGIEQAREFDVTHLRPRRRHAQGTLDQRADLEGLVGEFDPLRFDRREIEDVFQQALQSQRRHPHAFHRRGDFGIDVLVEDLRRPAEDLVDGLVHVLADADQELALVSIGGLGALGATHDAQQVFGVFLTALG